MTTELKAVIFDFGGYVVDGDHPWHRVGRGEITLEAASVVARHRLKVVLGFLANAQFRSGSQYLAAPRGTNQHVSRNCSIRQLT